jgi:hypothetical protein
MLGSRTGVVAPVKRYSANTGEDGLEGGVLDPLPPQATNKPIRANKNIESLERSWPITLLGACKTML